MEIYLVRHGETDWNKELRLQGWADISLNGRGREEAESLARELAGVHFDLAWCSDLDRAAETAEIILRDRGVPLSVDPRLREMGFGPIEGNLYGQALKDPSDPLHLLVTRPDRYRPEFGGELLAYVSARFDAFCASELARAQAENPGACALIVSHGIMVRDIITRAGGYSYDDFWKLPVGNCSCCVLGYDGSKLSVRRLAPMVGKWLC